MYCKSLYISVSVIDELVSAVMILRDDTQRIIPSPDFPKVFFFNLLGKLDYSLVLTEHEQGFSFLM